MCRLYAMHANEPTRVECALVVAQNALITQSQGDREGLTHGQGWGVADYPDGVPLVEKQAWAAYHGEHFKKKAARVYARTVVAHVRRATVGSPSLENTHPFEHGRWIFAHNGTVPGFDELRHRFLEEMNPLHRSEIQGTTDSEHIFRLILSRWMHQPATDLIETVSQTLEQIAGWARQVKPGANIGLNIVLTDGDQLVGSRLGRTLFFIERREMYHCRICGKPHVHHDPKQAYRAVEVASETITDEDWKGIPDGTVYSADPDYRLRFRPMALNGGRYVGP